MLTKGFASTMRKGFQITFDNRYTASVQWGAGNYCDNHLTMDEDLLYFKKDAKSSTAEIAVFYKGKMTDVNPFLPKHLSSGGTVAGWIHPEEVVEFLCNVKNANK